MNDWPVFDMPQADIEALWSAIACPTLLLYGADSWASNPEKDGRIEHFNHPRVIAFENAGHWLHHDQFAKFMSKLDEFHTIGFPRAAVVSRRGLMDRPNGVPPRSHGTPRRREH